MSLFGAMTTGISGLRSNGLGLSVVSDNIANFNTVGFKQSRVVFGDLVASISASNGGGAGSFIMNTQSLWSQGAINQTVNPLDMAIQGDGLFVLNADNGITYYSRAGQFMLNKDGYLVNPLNYKVQGYGFDASGLPTGKLGNIQLSNLTSTPIATSELQLGINLDSQTSIKTWSATDPNTTTGEVSTASFNHSNSLYVYDSLGNKQLVKTYYTKTAVSSSGSTWELRFVYNTGTEANPAFVALGPVQLNFDTNGNLTQDITQQLSFNWAATIGAVTPQIMNLSIKKDDAKQWRSPADQKVLKSNGRGAGSAIASSISQNGIISVIFSNGDRRDVAQIALSEFANYDGLIRTGDNLFLPSYDSGEALVGTPGSSKRGTIFGNALEMSNVDLADEFVKMIQLQRGFQASSKVITTADALTGEVMNLIR
ncbi:MAG TPA: flagellar hook protein FlgE [Nitrospirae bacterium]|nr:flagellar hook protein FlgE [Nitrospirota bacterium]